jgi:hypothetical protein
MASFIDPSECTSGCTLHKPNRKAQLRSTLRLPAKAAVQAFCELSRGCNRTLVGVVLPVFSTS